MASEERANGLAMAQGAFYVATGVWPILHLRSFEAVTGPKADGWLVKTVGGLIAVAGGALAAAGARGRVTPEIAAVGAGCAAVLAAIDVVYTSKRRIAPVYLLDAAAEAVLIAAWAGVAGELDTGDGNDGKGRTGDGDGEGGRPRSHRETHRHAGAAR